MAHSAEASTNDHIQTNINSTTSQNKNKVGTSLNLN
jgi:hypothetical protein